MKLPIEIVEGLPPGYPLSFRWRSMFKPVFGDARVMEMTGELPQHADVAVADLIGIAKQQHQELERLQAENAELRERLGEELAGRPPDAQCAPCAGDTT